MYLERGKKPVAEEKTNSRPKHEALCSSPKVFSPCTVIVIYQKNRKLTQYIIKYLDIPNLSKRWKEKKKQQQQTNKTPNPTTTNPQAKIFSKTTASKQLQKPAAEKSTAIVLLIQENGATVNLGMGCKFFHQAKNG